MMGAGEAVLLDTGVLVYATLDSQMQSEAVHALSMRTFTPAEWAAQGK